MTFLPERRRSLWTIRIAIISKINNKKSTKNIKMTRELTINISIEFSKTRGDEKKDWTNSKLVNRSNFVEMKISSHTLVKQRSTIHEQLNIFGGKKNLFTKLHFQLIKPYSAIGKVGRHFLFRLNLADIIINSWMP